MVKVSWVSSARGYYQHPLSMSGLPQVLVSAQLRHGRLLGRHGDRHPLYLLVDGAVVVDQAVASVFPPRHHCAGPYDVRVEEGTLAAE